MPVNFFQGSTASLTKKAVHRRLDRKAQFVERLAGHHLGADARQRHPCRLADKGHGAAGARVHLQHVDDIILDRVLHIHQPAHTQPQAQFFGVLAHDVEVIGADLVGRQHAGTVAAVDASFFDVLHDAADHHARAIDHGIHIHLVCILQELVDQDRPLLRHIHRLGHVAAQIGLIVDNRHRPPAQHI
jgi:hypothetical protein